MFSDRCWMPLFARRLCAAALGALCLFAPLHALAHKGSDAYLVVGTAPDGQASLRLSVALKDLDVVLPIDTDQDGQVTWGEVRAAAPVVAAHLGQVLQGSGAEASDTCSPDWSAQGLERRSDGAYWVAEAIWPCGTDRLRMPYHLMEEADRSHRLLVSGQWGGQPVLATVAPGEVLELGRPASGSSAQTPAATVWNYIWTGAAHMLEGYDHMAFLLALVLPLYLPLRRPLQPMHVRPLQPAGRSSDWLRMFSTVTAFTLGHSVTLGLVAMGWLRVSSDWVEPAIVLSIGISALLNLYPVRWLRTDVLAGVFGLVHGMGFAGLLLDAQAPLSLLPWALLGFNLGIEAAQLLILLVWVLVCQPLLAKPWYATRFVRGLSSALVAFSAILLSRFAV
jgi:hypothetical protein